MPEISTTPVKHPNTKGTEPRTRLAGGPFVDTTTTLAQFTIWAKSGISQGVIIDRLASFAVNMGYDPVTSTVKPMSGFTVPSVAINAAFHVLFPSSPSPIKVSPAAPKSQRG
jgi:hypothetical protein